MSKSVSIEMWAPFIENHARTYRIVNEAGFNGDPNAFKAPSLFYMTAGQISPRDYYVWAMNFEEAFEALVEALDDDGACGYFTTLDESDFQEAADDLGVSWDGSFDHPNFDQIRESAEADLTIIGHTSLRTCEAVLGSGPLYIHSFEWDGEEVDDDDEEVEAVMRMTMIQEHGHPFLAEDKVYFDDGEDQGYFEIDTVCNDGDLNLEEYYQPGSNIHNQGRSFGCMDADDMLPAKPPPGWTPGQRIEPGFIRRISASAPGTGRRSLATPAKAPAPAPPPPAPPHTIPDEEPHWPAKDAPGRTLTPNEVAIVGWMMRMGWHDDREKAIKHVLKMRESGHPWITRGAPLDGLDDEMIAVLIQDATPTTFFGIPMPSYARRR